MRHNSIAYTFDSEPSSRIHQAVRDAALRAVAGLRSRDPEMTKFRRYAFFPRAISRLGECLFPVCPDEEDPALIHFARFTNLLSYHMAELHRTFGDTRTALAESMADRATLVDTAALAAPPPPPPPPSSPSQAVVNSRGPSAPNGTPVGSRPILVRITPRRPRPAELSREEPPAQRTRTAVQIHVPEESDPEEPEEGEYSPEPIIPGRN